MATKCETWASELVALKAKTASLLSSFNNATTSAIGYIDGFQNGFGKYACGSKLKSGVAAVRNGIVNDNPNNASFTNASINLIQFDAGQCQGGSLNCSKAGCVAAVNSMNSALTNYFNARKALVQNMIDISTHNNEIANDAQCIAEQNAATQQNQIDQGKNRQLRNGIIWTVVIVAIIGVGVWAYKKWFA